MSIDALLEAIADGHPSALGELLRRHGAPAVNVALRSLLDAAADEATLTFLRRAALIACTADGSPVGSHRRR